MPQINSKTVRSPSLWNLFLFFFLLMYGAIFSKDLSDSTNSRVNFTPRNFKTFLPHRGESIDKPSSELVQILLDRQDKGDFESYMVQIVFRGTPPRRNFRIKGDRILIDFYDSAKPSMRISKIKGGVIEANSVEEFYYKTNALTFPDSLKINKGEANQKPKKNSELRIKTLVRLTLYLNQRVDDLKFRDTLDRTLIHFRISKSPNH